MKFVKISFTCLILAFVVSCSVAVDNVDVSKVSQDAVTKKPEDTVKAATTTPPPTITTTTTPPPTITTTTTPPPPPPKSTTPPPPPPKSTTSPPPPKSTTAAPTSTVSPSEDVWSVASGNKTCIMMKCVGVIKVSYVLDNKTQQQNTTELIIPQGAKVEGSCGDGNSTQFLTLSWPSNASDESIQFVFNKTKETYFIEDINIKVQVAVTNNNKTTEEAVNLKFTGNIYSANVANSYTCSNPNPVDLSGSTLNATGQLALQSLQYEAFGQKNNSHSFSASQDCLSQDGTPDIIPILVAGALILLVVVVLVAYVITRRRSQARGYTSM